MPVHNALKHVPVGESRCPVLVAPAFAPSTSSLDEWVTGRGEASGVTKPRSNKNRAAIVDTGIAPGRLEAGRPSGGCGQPSS